MKAMEKKESGLLKKIRGLWKSENSKPVKSTKDLSAFDQRQILKACRTKAVSSSEISLLPKLSQTVGVISFLPRNYYPLIESKAALISQITGISTIPLLLECKKPKELGKMLSPLSASFTALYGVGIRHDYASALKEANPTLPYITDAECEAACVVAAAINGCRVLRIKPEKSKIVLLGSDELFLHLIPLLLSMKLNHLTLTDHKGTMLPKRPNMNKLKNELVKMIPPPKPATLNETLADANVIICADNELLQGQKFQKKVIISLSALPTQLQPGNIIVSTEPGNLPSVSDVLPAAILLNALTAGRPWNQELMLKKVIQALTSSKQKVTAKKLFPHMLEQKKLLKLSKHL